MFLRLLRVPVMKIKSSLKSIKKRDLNLKLLGEGQSLRINKTNQNLKLDRNNFYGQSEP